MACDRCRELDVEQPIRSRAELSDAIRVVRANVVDGTLVEAPAPESTAGGSLSELSTDGPWPDVVHHLFRCATCDAAYELVAETYHGSGGHWSRVRCA